MLLDLKIFITLFLAVFVTIMGVGIVAPLLPVYAHELGAGAFQIGLIFGAFSLTRSIFVPYFGKLSDVKGKKPLLTLGMFLYFILSILYIFSPNVEMLILLRLSQGFASAMIFPVAQAYVGMITPKNKEGFTMGLFNISLYGGLSIGPILGGVVKDWFDIRVSFLSMGALTLVGFSLCLLLLPPEKDYISRQASVPKKPIRYLKLMKEPVVFSLFAFRLCFTVAIGLIWAFLPLLASTQLSLSSSTIGVVLMISVLVSGVFQAPMGFLADRFSKKFLITLGGILGALSVFYIQAGKSFEELFLASALFGLAGGVSFPAVMALGVIEGRRIDAMGSIMGLLAMAHSIGMLIGPLLAGIVIDLFSFTVVFVLGTLILAAGTLVFLIFHRSSQEQMGTKI
ncbi:MAG: MFS transporter [Deltaproteobacteria bacterium]|nr:MAG: MFS transporter [Deltaproteobacteria bacterium]